MSSGRAGSSLASSIREDVSAASAKPETYPFSAHLLSTAFSAEHVSEPPYSQSKLASDKQTSSLMRCPARASSQLPVPWSPAKPLSQADDEVPSGDDDGAVATEEAKPELKLKKPPLYKVILINDDYTPMEFVVEVLETFFKMNREQATQVMLAVHTQGKGVCGIYTRDIAETKAAQVNQFARDHQHPLLCEIEASED